MTIFLVFFANHWKPIVGTFLVIGLCFGAFATGRWLTPPKVTETEKIVNHDVYHIVKEVQKVEVEKKVYVAVKTTAKHSTTHIVKKPDGTVDTTVVVDSGTKTDTSNVVDKTDTVKVASTVDIKKDDTTERTRVTDGRPSWRVTPMLGVNVLSIPTIVKTQKVDWLNDFHAGVMVEHRLVGPFSIGGYALSSGQVGASFSIEF